MLHTGGGDGERTLDCAQFLVGDERRVRTVADIDLARLQEASDILTTEAVADGGNSLHAKGLTHVFNGLLNNGVDIARLVLGEPSGKISLARFHIANRDLIALEQVGNNCQEAIVGELVGQELSVGENAEDVSQE